MNAPPPAPAGTDHVQRSSDEAAADSRLRRIASRALFLGASTGLGIGLAVGFVLGCRPVLRVTTVLVAGPVLLAAAPTAVQELRLHREGRHPLFPRGTRADTQPPSTVPDRIGEEWR
ncbi:hypothetical protein [Kitasatospora sp. NRRL B-11411]|uniref:hypothetical protein n=1 Tax=Kitasatospora sp. NRRL B-11411 TaxID=1463822 RepID=UPI0004C3B7D1|nr:hypothetical protein [Kitasatospora sp. NRRL B-11411]